MNTSNDDDRKGKSWQSLMDTGLLVALIVAVVMVQRLDRASVDLVFVIDQRPVMRDYLDAIKTNCLEKAQGLESGGINCRFAVIAFGGTRKRVPLVPLTADFASFKQQLMAVPADTETTWAASSSDALKQALALEFRKDASVIVFLISKTPFTDDRVIATVAKEIDERGIATIVQADASEKDRCLPLYRNGGRFYSLDGDDLTGPNVATNSSHNGGKQIRNANLLARLSADKMPEMGKVKGIFALRTALNRAEIIATLGGSNESEFAVQEGLAWLARHQADDGYWSDSSKCEKDHRCDHLKYGAEGAANATNAETGLAILAFQAGGNYYFNDHKYSANVKKGLDWLVERQQKDGCLFGAVQSWYEHGMATFALAEACAVALANDEIPDPSYLDAVQRAIKFIEAHQYRQGGWQYALDSGGIGDASVTGWQMLAIKSAMEAKVDVSAATIEKLTQFFETVGDPETGVTGYQHRGGGTDLTTAVGLIFQEFILNQPHSPFAEKAIEHLRVRAPVIATSGDYYGLYNGTLAMFLARGEGWKQWNNVVRDAVVNQQAKADCTRGSWNGTYGRTLSTAWAVLTLEVYYRYAAEAETK